MRSTNSGTPGKDGALCLSCGQTALACQHIFRASIGEDYRDWCCRACRENGAEAMHKVPGKDDATGERVPVASGGSERVNRAVGDQDTRPGTESNLCGDCGVYAPNWDRHERWCRRVKVKFEEDDEYRVFRALAEENNGSAKRREHYVSWVAKQAVVR